MFLKGEIKRNLLGSLEIALLMPDGSKRFRGDYHEMLRSFFVPVVLFPFTLLIILFNPANQTMSSNILALIFSLRIWCSLGVFLGLIYFICRETDRMEHFFKFVSANNWLTVPATAMFLPVLLALTSGNFTWQELQPFMMCLVMYCYFFTAFMASYVLKIPMELGYFVGMIGMAIDNGSSNLLNWLTLNVL